MKTIERILWRDIWHALRVEYEVRADSGKVIWVNWRLYEVVSFEGIDETRGAPAFERAGADSPIDTVATLDAAEAVAEGFIKWDGCMQFNVPHVHFDERDGVGGLGSFCEALHRIRDKAQELCGPDFIDRGLSRGDAGQTYVGEEMAE